MESYKKEGPILEVRELSSYLKQKNEKVLVVDNVSFHLMPGKTLALVGESGCGKSMTALSLMRILPPLISFPSEGEVLYRGVNLLTLSENEMRKFRGKAIAMIFQDPMSALNPVYTIGNQLTEPAIFHLGLDEEDAFELAIRTLMEVGIPNPKERMDDYPHQISGGMKQRVMIAMALICKPDILIADEPTTALDVTIQAQVIELMKMLQEKHRMAILLITHDMGVVAEMADEVAVMYSSQIVERAKTLELFDHMAHPYTKGLFLARPSGKERKERLYSIEGSVPEIGKYPLGCRFHPRCPYVLAKCKEKDAIFFTDESKDHSVRCWLFEKEARYRYE